MRFAVTCGYVAIFALAVVAAVAAYQPSQVVDRQLSINNGFITLDQPGRHAIHIKPQSVTAFAVWSNHPEFKTPAVMIVLGAKTYRIDASTKTKAEEIESFLLKHAGM